MVSPIAVSLSRYRDLETLRDELAAKEVAIRSRLADFRAVGQRDDRALFEELCFAILAIQSSARSSDSAVQALVKGGLLWSAGPDEMARFLQHRTRFHNHKAAYIVCARERFFPAGRPRLREVLDRFHDPEAARDWLVAEVDGLGFKEASHFLRNIGRGEDLAILDRHILHNLLHHHVIGRMPRSLTPKRYRAIEARLQGFAESVGVPVGVLDLLWWSRQTGEIFK